MIWDVKYYLEILMVLEHMLGSGRVNFVKTDKDIIVTIFNVTNITSGAFVKILGRVNHLCQQ